jgi:hypothetical protein
VFALEGTESSVGQQLPYITGLSCSSLTFKIGIDGQPTKNALVTMSINKIEQTKSGH